MYRNIVFILSTILILSCAKTPPDTPSTSNNATLLADCGESVAAGSYVSGLNHNEMEVVDQDSSLNYGDYEEDHSGYAYIELFLQAETLYLIHRNALFNCCPQKISFNTEIEDSVIYIKETESFAEGSCSCDCCYDIEVKIPNVENKSYKIIIEELHLNPKDDQIEIEVDFNQAKEKTYQFIRSDLGTSIGYRDHSRENAL